MLGQLSAYSAFGKEVVSLAAPGDHILVFNTEGEDQYYYEYGTSFAAPHVTGALVLLLSAFPHCKLPQLVHRLLHTVDQSLSLRGKCRSGGRLNIGNALKQDLVGDFGILKSMYVCMYMYLCIVCMYSTFLYESNLCI